MRGLLTIATLVGAAMLVVGAPLPKIGWCHFPPGQWTGDPATSKVTFLSIDENGISGHKNHDGDGPTDADVTYKGVTYKALGADCKGACGTALILVGETQVPVQLIKQGGQCVCPVSKTVPVSGFCGGNG